MLHRFHSSFNQVQNSEVQFRDQTRQLLRESVTTPLKNSPLLVKTEPFLALSFDLFVFLPVHRPRDSMAFHDE